MNEIVTRPLILKRKSKSSRFASWRGEGNSFLDKLLRSVYIFLLFAINFVMFIIASIVSRGLRFFLIAGLIWKFGAPIKTFIDKYFNLLAIAFTVLLVGSFFLIGKLL